MDVTALFATHPRIEDRIRVLEQLGGVQTAPLPPPSSAPSIDAHPHGPWNRPPHEQGPWGPHDGSSPPSDPPPGPWGPHSS
jgi:hypothetical protein